MEHTATLQADPFDVAALIDVLDAAGDDRAAAAEQVAARLARLDDVTVLRRSRPAAWELSGHADIAVALAAALRSCSGSCQVRQFWLPLLADRHGPQLIWPQR